MTEIPQDRSVLRDIVVDAVNAHDLELLTQADGIDFPDELVDRMRRVFERRPRTMLTRADLRGSPVAAVWMPDREERYVQVGHLEFVVDEDGSAYVEAVTGPVPGIVSEAPPGLRVAEWESAQLADTGEGWWV
jgi:hypothetical protein